MFDLFATTPLIRRTVIALLLVIAVAIVQVGFATNDWLLAVPLIVIAVAIAVFFMNPRQRWVRLSVYATLFVACVAELISNPRPGMIFAAFVFGMLALRYMRQPDAAPPPEAESPNSPPRAP